MHIYLLPITKHTWEFALELSFSDAKVRDLYCSQSGLAGEFGAELARKICCRLALLTAAPSLGDVPADFPVALAARDAPGCFSVALGPSHRLLFQAIPMEGAKMSELSHISRLLIIGLVAVSALKARRS